MLDKLKIKLKKVKEFINQMSPMGLQQSIQNLNDKRNEGIREIRFGGFLHLKSLHNPEEDGIGVGSELWHVLLLPAIR